MRRSDTCLPLYKSFTHAQRVSGTLLLLWQRAERIAMLPCPSNAPALLRPSCSVALCL